MTVCDELVPAAISLDKVKKKLCIENILEGFSKNLKKVVENKVGQHIVDATDGGEFNFRWLYATKIGAVVAMITCIFGRLGVN